MSPKSPLHPRQIFTTHNPNQICS
nr:unnamed protein product [Callosobruchus analis]